MTGVSAVTIRNRELADVETFGETRIGGSPVTRTTLFQAASVSKPVTALAVLCLVDAGRLDLDADVNGYLTSWQLPLSASRFNAAVTLRRLLSHTAGVTVHGFPGYVAGTKLPTPVQILEGASPANTPPVIVDMEPGSAWRYSGGGYIIVQQIIEDVVGHPFADVMHNLVFSPLGMCESSFAQPLVPQRHATSAQPHDAAGAELSEGAHVYPEMAAAGLWTTAVDLGRFAISLKAALRGESDAILSKDLACEMVSPVLKSFGLGLLLGSEPSCVAFGHSGANAGFRSWMWIPVDRVGLIVMTNGDNGQILAQELFSAINRLSKNR